MFIMKLNLELHVYYETKLRITCLFDETKLKMTFFFGKDFHKGHFYWKKNKL